MSFSSFLLYIRSAIPSIPWWHWSIIVFLSLGTYYWCAISRVCSIIRRVALGISVLIGMLLLDATVFNRIGAECIQFSGLDLGAEFHRIVDEPVGARIIMFFNVAAFFPFGIASFEFLLASQRLGSKRCIWRVALAAAILSLLIEFLQWLLKVGLFELTDIVMNTIGAVFGAVLALGVNRAFYRCRHA